MDCGAAGRGGQAGRERGFDRLNYLLAGVATYILSNQKHVQYNIISYVPSDFRLMLPALRLAERASCERAAFNLRDLAPGSSSSSSVLLDVVTVSLEVCSPRCSERIECELRRSDEPEEEGVSVPSPAAVAYPRAVRAARAKVLNERNMLNRVCVDGRERGGAPAGSEAAVFCPGGLGLAHAEPASLSSQDFARLPLECTPSGSGKRQATELRPHG